MANRSIKVTHSSEVAVVWLDRPDTRNAMDGPMVGELDAALRKLESNNSVRAVVLAGHGASFCSGIDVRWMKRMAVASTAVNTKDAMAMARLLQRIDSLGKPTLARVHGATFAEGLGLVAACDIAVAALDAEFCVSETRIGVCPGTIAPYLLRAIGERQARRYFLSGERFSAAEAYRIGLVHELAPPNDLDSRINEILGHLLAGGPVCVPTSKRIINQVTGNGIRHDLTTEMAHLNARLRASQEGKEGIDAFLGKRHPSWIAPLTRKAPRKNRLKD